MWRCHILQLLCEDFNRVALDAYCPVAAVRTLPGVVYVSSNNKRAKVHICASLQLSV